MKAEELASVLADHAKWLANPSQGKRANLTRANLTRADLTRANLTGANLSGADLTRANLTGAYLTDADLARANLTDADLSCANLTRANLSGANLSGADLTRANLTGANLYGADLSGANLSGADLTRANLYGAELGHRSIVPSTGNFTAWKKLRFGVIAEMEIIGPRVSPYTDRKCRCASARVAALHGTSDDYARSIHDPNFVYRVGEIVSVPAANLDPREVCTAGIHFFLTREEAEAYNG
jgi:uncharacterized protein YjbI with pentapeptide repeats